MELEAAIGNTKEGFLVLNVTTDRISARRVRYAMQPVPFFRFRKVAETISERDITTPEEKERVSGALGKMLGYLKDAEERYTSRYSSSSGTCWCFIIWAGDKVYYSSGQNAFPSWWNEACTLILGEQYLFRTCSHNSYS
ncbi:MAG: hypothetical protein C4570_03210 [Ammonifex sp.]|nr:MAG: hypothetical protein C4570_03210 [Ammonifex sp.]